MSYIFIVNPQAGKGACGRKWAQFYNEVKDSLGRHETFLTQNPGEGEAYARKRVTGVDVNSLSLIAVGGDGTANEVLNGVAGTEATIGILPFGTGNDLAKGLGITTHLTTLIAQFKNNYLSRTEINIGKMNNRFFASSAGVGFDGLVANYANQHRLLKNSGKLGYLLSALKLAGKFQPYAFDLIIDDAAHSFSKAWLLAIGNCPYYGGGMKICPHAQPDDDWLDLCIVHNLSKSRFFQLFPSVYKGTHVKETSSVTIHHGKTITIQANPTFVLTAHADGEFIQASKIEIKLCGFKQKYII